MTFQSNTTKVDAMDQLNKSYNNIRTVRDLVRAFKPDINEPSSTRLCRFLNLAAEVLPKTYISKTIAAKIAFLQSRTPNEDSDWVKKKLPKIMTRTKNKLKSIFGKGFDFDFVDGIRATVDSDDTALTERRRAKNRVVSAINSLNVVDKIVDVNQMKDQVAKKEVMKDRRLQLALYDYRERVLLLPPKQS